MDSQQSNYVCKIREELYGLKQAPRAWYIELKVFLLSCGFVNSKADTSLFIYSHGKSLVYLLVYVDDLILTGNNRTMMDNFASASSAKFSIKDVGMLNYFLGVEVLSTQTGIFFSQKKYKTDILNRAVMLGAKEVSTSLPTNQVLTLLDGTGLTDATLYHQTVGSLQYLSLSRPDIAFVVHKLSQFMHKPIESHWSAVSSILKEPKIMVFF